MAEMRVAVENATTIEEPLFITPGAPPGLSFYFYTLFDTPGVVASNNFLSVFNPAGSGKLLIFYQAEIVNYSNGVTDAFSSLTATRITAASAGTLVAASNISRFVTSTPDPVAVVRVGNPSVTTTGLALNAWPPPVSDKAGSGAQLATSTPPGAGFVCLPGQGIVFNTLTGDVNQLWKINTIWAEQSI